MDVQTALMTAVKRVIKSFFRI